MLNYNFSESETLKEARRRRSLRTCHRFSRDERPRGAPPRESAAYVPEIAARLDDDRNLTDGAKRCARKVAEITYRTNRDGRCLEITVTYLAKALGRCRRTVQRYLRQLEGEGYIRVAVVAGARSRLCVGVVIDLLGPLFPRHRQERWPRRLENPGATRLSLNQRFLDSGGRIQRRFSAHEWALKCMDGVFRALMETNPLHGLPLPVLGQEKRCS